MYEVPLIGAQVPGLFPVTCSARPETIPVTVCPRSVVSTMTLLTGETADNASAGHTAANWRVQM